MSSTNTPVFTLSSLQATVASAAQAAVEAPKAGFEAPPLHALIGDIELAVPAKAFSTGSLGWYASTSAIINGLPCRVNVQVVVSGSKKLSALKTAGNASR